MRTLWQMGAVLILLTLAVVGCRSGEPTAVPANVGLGDTYASKALNTVYPGALSASGQLMLGTLKLEGTDQAVAPEQAKALLPLWQAFQGNALRSSAERNAVLAQIEAEMTPGQLQAIAAMHLTQDDLRVWIREQGAGPMPGPGAASGEEVSPKAQATRRARLSSGEIPPEMATRRAQFQNMSEEQRAALRATAQTGSGPLRAVAGTRAGFFLLRPLIELLEARAAER